MSLSFRFHFVPVQSVPSLPVLPFASNVNVDPGISSQLIMPTRQAHVLLFEHSFDDDITWGFMFATFSSSSLICYLYMMPILIMLFVYVCVVCTLVAMHLFDGQCPIFHNN